MNTLASMLQAHPRPAQHIRELAKALGSLAICEQICVICADACLAEKSAGKLRACVHLTLECAEICGATARLLLHQVETAATAVHEVLHACAVACQACGDECASHAGTHGHCAICAEICRQCQEGCTLLIGELAEHVAVRRD